MKMDISKMCRGAVIALSGFALLCTQAGGAEEYVLNYPDGTNITVSTPESYSRIIVGLDQPDNQLDIVSGGDVDVESMVEVGQQVDAENSQLSVSDGGRLVIGAANTNSLPASGIIVGDSSGSGELKAGFDSRIETDNLYVGVGTDEAGSVTAKNGAEISVSGTLAIGAADNSNNRVTIEDGSSLYISETSSLQVNNAADATENRNGLNIATGGALMVKGDVDASALSSNEGITFESGATIGIGGTLSAKDNSINYGLTVLLDDTLSTNHTATWDAAYIEIGNSTSDNTLTLLSGASATSTGAVSIGTDDTASRNLLSIEGSNSTFHALDSVYVGVNGSQNTMEVLDGGRAVIDDELKIGSSISSDNMVEVSGTNSSLEVAQDVYVGNNGRNSTLDINDGALATFDSDLYLGSKSANNRYTLTGSTNTVAGDFIIGETEDASGSTSGIDTSGNLGSVEDDAFLDVQNLTVGKDASGSVLIINEGSVVHVNGDSVIGETSDDNFIYLEGDNPDTRFNVTGDLIVGNEGGVNRFAVYGGVANIDENVIVGNSTLQHESENYIHLQTTNAALNVAKAIHIGASNSLNKLTLAAGANANTHDLYVGAYEGSSNNYVTVSGENNSANTGWYGYVTNSTLSVSNQLVIGSESGSGNSVTVRKGGILHVSAQENLIINGTNNTLTINDEGTLKTGGWDFDMQTGQATNIVFDAGSILHLLGALEGTNMVEGEFNVVLDGDDASWAVVENLFVGNETGNNTLTLTNGATASVSSNLYIGFDSSDNAVSIGGLDSYLSISNNLQLGAEVDAWQENNLTLSGDADVWVGNDVYVYRGSTLKIEAESQLLVDGDYVQDQYSALEIGVSSNQVDPNLVVEGDAGFESSYNSNNHDILKIFNNGISESSTVKIVKAGSISLDGEEATAASINGSISTNSLLGFTLTLTNEAGYSYIVLDNFIVRSTGEAGGLEGQLLDVADEVDWMYENGSENATNMIRLVEDMDEQEINTAYNNAYGAKQSSTPANTVLGIGIQNVAEQLTVRADNTRARMGAASTSTPLDKPAGTAGPHQAEQQLQGWISGYGTDGGQDAADGFTGHDATLYGFLIGVDLSVAENLLVGVAGGTGSSTIDKKNGGTSDLSTTYGSLYASMGTKDWFADASIIYGGSSVDSILGTAFDTTADYDAQNIAFYFGGGKEIISEYLIITPQASMLANYYKQDDYSENSSGVGRQVEGFDTLYFQSSLGCNLGFYTAMGETTLKTEVRAHWLHEFNNDEESVAYQLIGGDGTTHTLFMQAPESDILKFGAGVTAKMSEYLELRLDLDTRQAKNYSDYTVMGALRYQF